MTLLLQEVNEDILTTRCYIFIFSSTGFIYCIGVLADR